MWYNFHQVICILNECFVIFFYLFLFATFCAKLAADADMDALTRRTTNMENQETIGGAVPLGDEITKQTLNPLVRVATADEKKQIITALLKTELLYSLDYTAKRDHRIVYDFLSKLEKNNSWTIQKKTHLTIVTMLSLAAQEFYWNPKSILDDLKNSVKRELRYVLFRTNGNPLDVRNIIFLDEGNLNRMIDSNEWINVGLVAEMRNLLGMFKKNELGKTFAAIKTHLDGQFGGAENLPVDNRVDFSPCGVAGPTMQLKHAESAGDGMCGQHSMFIPTDGNRGLCTLQGSPRYKMLRAIIDNKNDPAAKRFLLTKVQKNDGPAFKEFINEQITKSAAKEANELRVKLNDYEQFTAHKELEYEVQTKPIKEDILRAVAALPKLEEALQNFNETLNNDAQLRTSLENTAFKNVLKCILEYITLLKSYIPALKAMLDPIQRSLNLKTDDEILQVAQVLKNFINNGMIPGKNIPIDLEAHGHYLNACIAICSFQNDAVTANNIDSLFAKYRDDTENLKNIKEDHLKNRRLKIFDMLPKETTDELLRALNSPEQLLRGSTDTLSQWMDSAGESTKLWAILHNLNVFVFSKGNEGLNGVSGVRPKLDVSWLLTDKPYNASLFDPQVVSPGEKHLSTVILTSPTAKNIFLDKKPNHYDKFIQSGDHTALARALRHGVWCGAADKYSLYPAVSR